jgi:hypothetical protein
MYGDKPRGPGYGYLFVVAIAILVAWFVLRPMGLQIRHVFETLVDAFSGH